ncbi:MAG: SUMF1/EgtB/PvdO family nonheme iron enzyme [Candidatus Tectomicrobia bacterium]|nr:SUMF1/EgtB/PvdO family nonheme iron enzyme [Candidatus Tectomicrobia bacterium]
MQMRYFTAVLAAAGLLALLAGTPLAAERVALVIGNANYAHAPRLDNPLNDATDVAAALTRQGFAVDRLDNADKTSLEQALHKLSQAASGAEIALVFYAGHGIEVDKRNFLVPVGARLASEQDVEFETVTLDLAMRAVGRASGLGLVILDACRDNPFVASMRREDGTRSIGRGLARVDPAGQTLVWYAAKEGQVAADGDGRNSPYTSALLAHLETPGLEVMDLYREVRDTVLKSTAGGQEPFMYGSLSRQKMYLVAQAAPAPADPVPPVPGRPVSERLTAEQLAAERLFWESVKDSDDPADIQAYLDRYPGGTYEVLARNRLRRLQDAGTPPAAVETAKSLEDALRLGVPERRLIQLGLAAEGFDPGPVDGLFGQKTRAAIGRWQASRGGEATLYLDVESAKLLLASGHKRQAAAQAERLRREQETREKAQREAQERARQEAEERARQEAEERARREAAAEAERRRREREPGRRFRDCAGCPEMVVVPAGSFTMGSPVSEEGRNDDEGPQHRVTIAEPFAVGVHEVTRGEFGRFVRETNRAMGNTCWVWDSWVDVSPGAEPHKYWAERQGGWRNPGFEQTDRHPAVCVNWDDAQAYVRWLSRETGKRYRLLSESEWEYVARARTRTAWYWGESASGQCRHANGADASTRHGLRVSCNDGHARTSTVGTYTKNGFGLYDVLGNVWEWVQDCWHDSYQGAPRDGRAWESGECSQRAARGGSWLSSPNELRSARRGWGPTGHPGSDLGFRIARTLTP